MLMYMNAQCSLFPKYSYVWAFEIPPDIVVGGILRITFKSEE
jgi:hypothetical protein